MPKHWITAFIAVLVIALGGAAVAGPESPATQASQTFRDCSDCPETVAVPAGTFLRIPDLHKPTATPSSV
jgi:hypothetical protein